MIVRYSKRAIKFLNKLDKKSVQCNSWTDENTACWRY
jgi:hypothetical protein